MIDTAVILAAGNGTRLRGVSRGIPKPLVKLAGVPILIRVMRLAQEAGIRRFVIVTGYEAGQIKDAINGNPAISAEVTYIHNDEYKTKSNGVSALKAREAVDGPFALLMADHIFEVETLKRLLRSPIGSDECVLAVDRKIQQVFDLDDATKVVEVDGRVVEIGKELDVYNAVDTGMFACTPALFDALEKTQSEGDGSLSDAITSLAQSGKMQTFDIRDAWWQDVDTPEMRREAEHRLARQLRKPTDGPIARLINRRVSIPISLALTRTPVTPNQISGFNLILGLAAGLAFATTDYMILVLAGIGVQFASIFDGVDGEVARLSFRGSPNGQWVDTITDNITYLALLVGIVVGQFRREPTMMTVWMGVIAFLAIVTGLIIIFQRIHSMGKGSLLDFKIPGSEHVDPVSGGAFWLYRQLLPIARRDVFAFGCMVLAFLNLPGVVFTLWVAGSVVFCIAVIHITSERVQRQLAAATVVE